MCTPFISSGSSRSIIPLTTKVKEEISTATMDLTSQQDDSTRRKPQTQTSTEALPSKISAHRQKTKTKTHALCGFPAPPTEVSSYSNQEIQDQHQNTKIEYTIAILLASVVGSEEKR
jgi:hypothetical protein